MHFSSTKNIKNCKRKEILGRPRRQEKMTVDETKRRKKKLKWGEEMGADKS